MKTKPFLLLLFLLTFEAVQSHAQTPVLSPDKIYGLNPRLYNGKFYTYAAPVSTEGSQFLSGPEFQTGSATINGKTFHHLLLNYDIYNQQVVLKYTTRNHNMMKIVLSDFRLQSFNMGERHFEVRSFPGETTQIYQVLGKGTYEILYYWRKDYNLQNTYGATNFKFSKPVRESYLCIGNKRMHFRNNNNFVKLFGHENRVLVSRYLRRNKINVKKSGPRDLLQLIQYCNTLSEK